MNWNWNRHLISMILGGFLAATYAWQLYESYTAGTPLRWLHVAGFVIAVTIVIVAAQSNKPAQTDD